MKKNAKQTFYKKAVVFFVVVLLCNFSFSNIAFAESKKDRSKKLLNPIAQFFCAIGDITIGLLQRSLQGELAMIYSGESEYKIKYSPGIILSGTLPVFNINFIEKPTEDAEKYKILETKDVIKTTAIASFEDNGDNVVFYVTSNKQKEQIIDEILEKVKEKNITDEEKQIKEEDLIDKNHVIDYIKTYQMSHKFNDEETELKIENTDMPITENRECYSSWLAKIGDDKWEQYTVEICHKVYYNEDPKSVVQVYEVKISINTLEKIPVIVSIAKILRNTVASWYKAMQEIALVGLLLVLIYLSIRMIINSSARRNSKM